MNEYVKCPYCGSTLTEYRFGYKPDYHCHSCGEWFELDKKVVTISKK